MYTAPGSLSALDYISQFKTDNKADANLLNLLGGKYRIPSDREWDKLKALLAHAYKQEAELPATNEDKTGVSAVHGHRYSST